MHTQEERLNMIIDEFCAGNKAEFARQMDEKPQTINNWLKRGFGKSVIYKILDVFPKINKSFIVDGVGEMCNSSSSSSSMSLSHGGAGAPSPSSPSSNPYPQDPDEGLYDISAVMSDYRALQARYAALEALLAKKEAQLDTLISLLDELKQKQN